MTLTARIRCDEAAQVAAEGGEDSRLIDLFTRRESPAERARRIARKAVDPAQAAAWRRCWLHDIAADRHAA